MRSQANWVPGRSTTNSAACQYPGRAADEPEIATMLRLSAAPRHLDSGLLIEADPEQVMVARRLHALIKAVGGSTVRLQPLPAPGSGRPDRHRISLDPAGGAKLARQVGLLDRHGRLISELPPQVIRGPVCDATAIWRAALLTSGEVTRPGPRATLQVHPPISWWRWRWSARPADSA